MPEANEPILYLHDADQRLWGVLISPELWERIKDQVTPLLPSSEPTPEPERPEPLADWETLKEYWDFSYPVNTEATCGECGQQTTDWQADEPRKFRLLSATLGGLVTFQCQQCKARIMKRHFKDKIETETRPHIADKDPKLNAYYGEGR